MPTTGAVISRVRRELLAGVTEYANWLSAGINASVTSLTLTDDLGALTQGSVFEIDLEHFYARAVDTTTKTVTVKRGWNGTVAATHATDAIVSRSRFPNTALLDFLNDDLRDLSSPTNGLFRMLTEDFAYTGDGLDIPITFDQPVLALYRIEQQIAVRDWRPVESFELIRDGLVADFPAGTGVRLFGEHTDADIRITYKAPFGSTTALTDDIESVTGFPGDADELLVLGVKIRAGANREVKRNFTESQMEPRRSSEVPPQAVRQSFGELAALRRSLIASELARLNQRYPQKLHITSRYGVGFVGSGW